MNEIKKSAFRWVLVSLLSLNLFLVNAFAVEANPNELKDYVNSFVQFYNTKKYSLDEFAESVKDPNNERINELKIFLKGHPELKAVKMPNLTMSGDYEAKFSSGDETGVISFQSKELATLILRGEKIALTPKTSFNDFYERIMKIQNKKVSLMDFFIEPSYAIDPVSIGITAAIALGILHSIYAIFDSSNFSKSVKDMNRFCSNLNTEINIVVATRLAEMHTLLTTEHKRLCIDTINILHTGSVASCGLANDVIECISNVIARYEKNSVNDNKREFKIKFQTDTNKYNIEKINVDAK